MLSLHIIFVGFSKEHIQIEINESGTSIVISGQKEELVSWSSERRTEIKRFSRDFSIPADVILDQIKARFDEHKILIISMPKRKRRMRRIKAEETHHGETSTDKSALSENKAKKADQHRRVLDSTEAEQHAEEKPSGASEHTESRHTKFPENQCHFPTNMTDTQLEEFKSNPQEADLGDLNASPTSKSGSSAASAETSGELKSNKEMNESGRDRHRNEEFHKAEEIHKINRSDKQRDGVPSGTEADQQQNRDLLRSGCTAGLKPDKEINQANGDPPRREEIHNAGETFQIYSAIDHRDGAQPGTDEGSVQHEGQSTTEDIICAPLIAGTAFIMCVIAIVCRLFKRRS